MFLLLYGWWVFPVRSMRDLPKLPWYIQWEDYIISDKALTLKDSLLVSTGLRVCSCEVLYKSEVRPSVRVTVRPFKLSLASRTMEVFQAELSKWNEYDDLTRLLNHNSISRTLWDFLGQCREVHRRTMCARSELIVLSYRIHILAMPVSTLKSCWT